jgi:hypothetical protein
VSRGGQIVAFIRSPTPSSGPRAEASTRGAVWRRGVGVRSWAARTAPGVREVIMIAYLLILTLIGVILFTAAFVRYIPNNQVGVLEKC